MSTTKRLRWLLVLGLVLLPGAVLSVVTWRLIGQERQLEAGRLAERRALMAARIAQRMLSRLELERANVRIPAGRGAVVPDSGVLLLVAPFSERGMALPWETGTISADSGSASADPAGDGERARAASYDQRIREGERLEFARNRPDLAADQYAAAAGFAPDAQSRVDAKLREAGAFARAGRLSEASAAFRSVAASPGELRDRDGMPLALYGAEGLLSADHADVSRVLEVLERLVGRTDLGPPALYALRDLSRRARAHADSINDPGEAAESRSTRVQPGTATTVAARADAVERSATRAIAVAERILDLRRDLPAVLSLAGAASPGPGTDPVPDPGAAAASDSISTTPLPSAWRPWGPDPWLVGLASDGGRRLVLVADPARLLRALGADSAAGATASVLSDVSLSTVPRPGAELLGPSFPALFAVLPDAVLPDVEPSGFGRVLLVVVLPLVLAVTTLAAFLLWRDVRREIETAGMRAQFVSSVSHELKTPLTSIRMYAQTLLMGRHRAESERQEYLETIVNESERLTRLINNVLDFSRIERGGRRYHLAPASLDTVVTDAARAMSYPLEQGGFDLRVRVDDSIPHVSCDHDALTQAVVNLLSNAVKFSGDSRIIELTLARENGEAAIRVRDRGHGIDRRHHEAVFERFFRTPDAESAGLPGTGLGLALVAHVAHAHAGRVELESTPGQGSTFTIRLPMDGAATASDLPSSNGRTPDREAD